jgi:glycosyltransferase involved in cell wall biosynthesis
MKITVLCPDLSNNCLGRAYFLAKVLQRRYDVEIVGPFFGKGIWSPVAGDKSVKYKAQNCRFYLSILLKAGKLLSDMDGDVIYVSKPLISSFGLALLRKRKNKVPLVIDIEDWQPAFYREILEDASLPVKILYVLYSLIFFYRTNSLFNSRFMEKYIKDADHVTVSNDFLKDKFGGTIVVHARDTRQFDPEKFDGRALRANMGIGAEKKVVMFLGTPRPHKGLEDLAKAVSMIDDPDVILLIVGIGSDRYSRSIDMFARKALEDRYLGMGMQPFDKIPGLLAVADAVVIPQRRSPAAEGQIPAKVFDAMSMAKPIVGTSVSDMEKILEGCGWIVEPGRPDMIAGAIREIFSDPDNARKMGNKARQRCIERYSWDIAEEQLQGIFERYEKKGEGGAGHIEDTC